MSFLPKSRAARRRLTLFLVIAPVLALAAGLALYGLRNAASLFLTPSEVAEAKVAPGRKLLIGGLVTVGSVVKQPDGQVEFTVTDNMASTKVSYSTVKSGDLPDLFREGQGVVAAGYFEPNGQFTATQIMAKHDEKYMPQAVKKQLQKSGEWRPSQATPS